MLRRLLASGTDFVGRIGNPSKEKTDWQSVLRSSCWTLLLLVLSAPSTLRAEFTYEKDVRPILKSHCFHCHGEGSKLRGGLDLRLRRLIVRGGDSGTAIHPGEPGKSHLVQRVRYREMPPGDKSPKLSEAKIQLLEKWIAQGAKTARPEPDDIDLDTYITEEERNFWAFQPIQRPRLPAIRSSRLAHNPIDVFLWARLEQEGLAFAPLADRTKLIRRLYLDLLGFPPTPEDVRAFLADARPDAYEQLVDRLLASPHYGERWARTWLDVAGYADSEGYTDADKVRPDAFRYRDYVIRSLNADKPYDQFLREQLAGDEMIRSPINNLTPEDVELLTATGFLRMAPDGTGSGGIDQPTARNDVMAKTVQIVSTSVLGLTVGCAQCHDHRYDPISHEDYHSFRAIFEPALDWKKWKTPPQRRISLYTAADRKRAAAIEVEAKKIDAQRLARQQELIEAVRKRELAKLPEAIRKTVRTAVDTAVKERSAEQKKLLKKYPSVNVSAGSLRLFDSKAAAELNKIAAKAAALRKTKPKQEYLRALVEPKGKPPQTFVFHRGDHEQPTKTVPPSELRILASDTKLSLALDDPSKPTTGRRLAYARWLTNGEHPLVARVIVNRVWMGHFGRGLVPTPGDFGALGVRPSHPKLLDWLASEFMRRGWSLKQLHKRIVCSTAYRQTSVGSEEAEGIDADNLLLSHFSIRRLEAEVLRDSVLRISGKYNAKPFGPPVPVMADRVGQFVLGIENLNAGRPGAVIPLKGEEFRRTVYTQQRRSRPLSTLDTFDLPALEPNCVCRSSSTVATQALLLMNSDFVQTYAKHLADRLAREEAVLSGQIDRAWWLVYSRAPSSEERSQAERFVQDQRAIFAKSPMKGVASEREALTSLCHALLSSNEYLYID